MNRPVRYTSRISSETTVPVQQQLAEKAHRAGNFAEAIRLQLEAVEEAGDSAVDARKLLSLYYYSAGQHEGALDVLRELRELAPDDIESIENLGVILRLLGRQEEAVRVLREVHALDPKRVNVCDALAHSYANLKDSENCQKFGRLSLELKDQQAEEIEPLRILPKEPPSRHSEGETKKDVISFSLWGANQRYTKGAIRNTQIATDMYPGWTVRFYCDDSVPGEVISRLRDYGAEIVMRPNPASFFDGLLWRFEVIDDPGVNRFLIRDCDSVFSYKERVAVEAWLQSDKWFHVMRDFPSHSEVILAGMWGGVSGVLPGVKELRENFKPGTAPTRTFDQQLLRECVWPIVRQSVLSHDSVYTGCIGSVPFPDLATLPPRFHVGQNEAAVRKSVFVEMPRPGKFGSRNVFLLSGLDEEAVNFCRQLINQLKEIAVLPGPSVPQLRKSVRDCLQSVGLEGGNVSGSACAGQDMLIALMRAAVDSVSDSDARCVGFEDPDGDIDFLSSLAEVANVKLLCVVRDPRDTASSRRITEVEEGLTLAGEWNEHLRTVVAVNQARPGTVELVRYEDLSDGKSGVSVGRLCRFLGLDIEGVTIRSPGNIDSGKPLPDELADAIKNEAETYLKRLQYVERSIEVSTTASQPSEKDD